MSYELEAVGNINPYMSWTTTWYFMAVKARFDTYQVPVNKPNQPDPIHTGSRTWYPGYPVPSTGTSTGYWDPETLTRYWY